MTDSPKNLETLRLAYEQKVADYVVMHGEDYDGSGITAAHDAYINAIRREIWEKVEPMIHTLKKEAAYQAMNESYGYDAIASFNEDSIADAFASIKAAIVGGGE